MTLGLILTSKPQTPVPVTNFCGALFFFMVHWPPVQEEKGTEAVTKGFVQPVNTEEMKYPLGESFSETEQLYFRVRGDIRMGTEAGLPPNLH